MRGSAPLPWLVGAALVGAFLSRSVWASDAGFHPDESTVLWMALDAVRGLELPDHGLVSSLGAYQPPGLVWLTMPFVAVGGGRPELVIVGFAMLNAAGVALLIATVARAFGLLYAVALSSFLLFGPDAFISAAVWHASLYTAAMALFLAAGIRLRGGSRWWAFALVATPGLYALIHYSGLVVAAPAAALLVLSRRGRELVAPVGAALGVVAGAWVPFLLFEVDRRWVDLRTVVQAGDDEGSPSQKIGEGLDDLWFSVTHLGQSLHDSVGLTWVLWPLVVLAVAIALVRPRWRDPGFLLPAVIVATGVLAQVVSDQGRRQDVLMLWLVPWYSVAAWACAQVVTLWREASGRRALTAGFVMLVTVVGCVDLVRAIRDTPDHQRLREVWHAARSDAPVTYLAGVQPDTSANTLYLPCDPPYDWGSEVWYLREVLDRGSGLRDAVDGGAFRWRTGPRCSEREARLRPE